MALSPSVSLSPLWMWVWKTDLFCLWALPPRAWGRLGEMSFSCLCQICLYFKDTLYDRGQKEGPRHFLPNLPLPFKKACLQWLPKEGGTKKLLVGDGYVHYFDCKNDYTGVHIKLHQIVCFKYMWFILCQIYFHKCLKSECIHATIILQNSILH